MASLPGGFDPELNPHVDQQQSTLIRDFLDQIGISEEAVEDLSVPTSNQAEGDNALNPFLVPDTVPSAVATAPEGEQISILLNPDADDGKVLIIQGTGNARVRGGGGDDQIQGGSGEDTVSAGNGHDMVQGGDGDDSVIGGLGNDVVYGNLGNDTVSTDEGADSFFGGQGDDQVAGGFGEDFLMGNLDADLVYGNAGSDIVYGNQQNDTLFGGAGADTLYGGQNDDTLEGGKGDDALHGNLGTDQFVFRSDSGVDVIYDFVKGQDTIVVAANINDLAVTTASDLVERVSSDASGNAVIDFGSGNVVTIDGVSATELVGDIGSYIIIG